MSENYPVDEEIRGSFIESLADTDRDVPGLSRAFDRWLEAHDREIRKKFADELTRKGIYSFDIHQIRQYASE